MSISMVRRLALGAVAVLALFAAPVVATAYMSGSCEAEAHTATDSVTFNQDVWHIHKDDIAGGSGQSSTKMTKAQVAAYALGIALPIAGGDAKPGSDGETQGSVEGIVVASYSVLGQRFTVLGTATGPAGSCTGRIQIILDDVNPFLTVLGGGGILVALVCVLIFLALARGGGGCLPRIVGGAFGLLGGAGAGLAGEQFGVIDATQPIGLVVAIAAAVVGFLIPGALSSGGGSGGETPPAAPAPPAPTQPAPMTPEDYGNTATDVFKGDDVPGGASVAGSAEGNASPSDRMGAKGDVLPPGGEGGGGPM